MGLKIEGTGRSAVLGDVVIRVRDTFTEAVHIDTDEYNAVSAVPGMFAELIVNKE